MTANPSWLESPSPQTTPTQPSWLETPKPQQQPQWLQTPEPSQKQGPQPPYGINNPKGGIFGVNPGVNVMGDFNTNIGGFNTPGIRPEFRSIVTQLANDGNRMGVYDFNRGHHYAPNDPHLDGRAMDVDTINGEPVGTRLSPNLGQFITQALSVDPRVRLGVPKQIYQQLGGLVGNGRIFVDDPAHIHVEFDPGAMYQHQQAAAVASPSPKWLAQTTPKPSAQPSPTASPLQPAQEASFGQVLQNVASTVEETGKGFFKEIHYEAGHPLEAYTDVEGVLQRGIAGYLSQADPTGKAIFTPPTRAAVGMAIYDAFHPHSPEVYNRDTSADIRTFFAPLNIPEANQGTWAHFGQAIVAQTMGDPVNLIPGVMEVTGAAGIAGHIANMAKVLDEMPEVQALLRAKQATIGKLADTAVSKFVNDWFGVRPELHQYLEPHAYNARLMIEHGANAQMDPLRTADESLLAEHEQALRGLQPDENGVVHLPDAVQQRYLKEPYVFGTPEMRQQAVELGYRPSDVEAAHPPMGLLRYNLRQDYQTLIRPPKETANEAVTRVSGGRYSEAPAGFELSRKGEQTMGDNQFDITANRLRMGRNVVRDRLIDQRTENYLSQYGGWKGDTPAHDVTALSNRPWNFTTPWGPFFKKLSAESIKMFPLPHGLGNVGQLAWNKGGWTAVGLGLKHAIAGLSDAQIERLKSLGLWAEYLGKDLNSPWRKINARMGVGGKVLDKGIDVSTSILNRLEGGFRQALLDLADHQHGFDPHNLQNEYKKAKDVMDALGDYPNINKVASVLQGLLGAPFVAFGMSIVPKAITKALRENPGRVAGSARAQTDLQSEKGGPLPPGMRLGGGVEENFARMVTDPVGFMESPSRIGLLGIPLQTAERVRHSEQVDPQQVFGEAAQSYGGPLGNIGSGLFGLAYPSPGMQRGQFALRAAMLNWMTGRYLGPERSAKAEQYYDTLEETGQYPKHFRRRHFQ